MIVKPNFVGELFNALGRYLSSGDEGLAIEIDPRERMAIFGEVHVERQRQDAEWGGPAHDDEHDAGDWSRYSRRATLAAAKSDAAMEVRNGR